MPWPLGSPRSNSCVPLPDFSFDSPGHFFWQPLLSEDSSPQTIEFLGCIVIDYHEAAPS
eukprot:COSAG01_NODE_2153_length_8291_cov_6.152832_7_plen_59_part_00